MKEGMVMLSTAIVDSDWSNEVIKAVEVSYLETLRAVDMWKDRKMGGKVMQVYY